MKRNSYIAKEKKLKRLLNCDKIFLNKNLGLLDVDIIKNEIRHSYIIKPRGIDSNSNDKKLNDLVIKHNELLIDLANHKVSDEEVKTMYLDGNTSTWIQMYTGAAATQTTRVLKKIESERAKCTV